MLGSLLVVILGFALTSVSQGQTTQVCIRDQVGLGGPAAAAFRKELDELATIKVPSGACEGSVQITILWDPPERYPSALGVTWVASGHVLPRIEIYLNPVLRLLHNVRAPAWVGRALARVAAHEVIHYRSQRTGHDAAGLFAASFSPSDLKPQPRAELHRSGATHGIGDLPEFGVR